MIEWIDINKKLPKKDCDVLLSISLDNNDFLCFEISQFFYESKDFEVGLGNSIFVSKKNNWQYYDNIGFTQEKVKITHWAYINEPKEKND